MIHLFYLIFPSVFSFLRFLSFAFFICISNLPQSHGCLCLLLINCRPPHHPDFPVYTNLVNYIELTPVSVLHVTLQLWSFYWVIISESVVKAGCFFRCAWWSIAFHSVYGFVWWKWGTLLFCVLLHTCCYWYNASYIWSLRRDLVFIQNQGVQNVNIHWIAGDSFRMECIRWWLPMFRGIWHHHSEWCIWWWWCWWQ